MAMENKQIIRNNPFHVMENNASYTRPSELDTLARMDVIEEPRTLSATFLNNADVVQERVSDEKFSNLKSAEENKGEMSLAEKFKIADEQYKTDRFIVKYKTDRKENFYSKVGAHIHYSKKMRFENKVARLADNKKSNEIELITLDQKSNPSDLAKEWRKLGIDEDIEYIQPDFKVNYATLDETVIKNYETILTEKENEIQQISLTETEINEKVTVAIIDTGIDIQHPELADKIWVNPLEIANDGIDNDNNGLIDDIYGWNFVENDNEVYNSSYPLDNAHGTHVAGIISGASDADDLLITNQNTVDIMPLRVFNDGQAYTSDIIDAIAYANSMGIKIINCSWGGIDNNPALFDAMENSDALFIVAAGNAGVSLEQTGIYPAAFDLPNKIAVTSVNADGGLSYFSNYSDTKIELAALGRYINSTLPEGETGSYTGTSMSAALVSGAVAAVAVTMGSNDIDIEAIKDALLQGSDKISPLQGYVKNCARLNIAAALAGEDNNELLEFNTTDDRNLVGFSNIEEGIRLFNSVETVQIATGSNHTVILKSDGTVWTWAEKTPGGVGYMPQGRYSQLRHISGLQNIIAVAAGGDCSLALRSDGTVWMWGKSYYLFGSNAPVINPVQKAGLYDIGNIATSGDHCLARRNDGYVFAWGYNYYGQLGDGTNTNRTTPVQLTQRFNDIAVGKNHSLARLNEWVYTWGNNSYGQIGDGSSVHRYTPVGLNNLSVLSISGGYNHSIVVTTNGSVYAWGNNSSGQLGDGTTTNRPAPVQVSGLNNVEAASAGNGFCLAVKTDGTVYAWGNNSSGQLGNGSKINSNIPLQVYGLPVMQKIAAGYLHSIALGTNGEVYAWGNNQSSQLGDGSISDVNVPVKIKNLDNVIQIDRGNYRCMALKSDGTVWSWGDNTSGQLGDGTTTNSYIPVQVTGLENIIKIAGGYKHGLALRSDGTVWAWGWNSYGQLGNGTTTNSLLPVQVSGLTNITDIAAGFSHNLAVNNNGNVWAWGNNENGQLGDGTTTSRYTPVQINSLNSIQHVYASAASSFALTNTYNLYAWGWNRHYECGYSQQYVNIPQLLSRRFDTIAPGPYHTLGVDYNSERLYAWGRNASGELGLGNSGDDYSTPTYQGRQYPFRIAAGDCHSLMIQMGVLAWGENVCGQLGLGNYTGQNTPQVVSSLPNCKAVAAGVAHSMALSDSGDVYVWGSNSHGQIGLIPLNKESLVPIQCWTTLDDYSDTYNNATNITSNQQINGVINHKYDEDWFCFTNISNFEKTIKVIDSAQKVAISVYDSNLNELGINFVADSTGQNASVCLEANGIYYIKLKYQDNQVYNGGAYSLIVISPAHYIYDANNRLDYIVMPTEDVIDYQYDANGNVLQIISQ
jgi:alpha-tubulin suppressor-like RCC1 family protein